MPSFSLFSSAAVGLAAAATTLVSLQYASADTSGKILRVNSINDFCIMLPSGPNITIGASENFGQSWCVSDNDLPEGSKVLDYPGSFIIGANLIKTDNYIQITGTFDGSVFGLVDGDQGGQYDNAPSGSENTSSCDGYGSYVEVASDTVWCIRCCVSDDTSSGAYCDASQDTAGCWNLYGGVYDGYSVNNVTTTPSWASETMTSTRSKTTGSATGTHTSSSSAVSTAQTSGLGIVVGIFCSVGVVISLLFVA